MNGGEISEHCLSIQQSTIRWWLTLKIKSDTQPLNFVSQQKSSQNLVRSSVHTLIFVKLVLMSLTLQIILLDSKQALFLNILTNGSMLEQAIYYLTPADTASSFSNLWL